MSVVVYGHRQGDEPFHEEVQTVTVNAHGGLVYMTISVAKGQKLIMRNAQNMEEVECRVAYLETAQYGKTKVGIEFLQPSPRFWGLSNWPSDWPLL